MSRLDEVQKFSKEFEELYSKYGIIGFQKQCFFAKFVEDHNWEADLPNRKIVFENLGSFKIKVVGTLNEDCFHWADQSCPISFSDELSGDVIKSVREFDVKEFKESKLEFEQCEGQDLWFHRLTCVLIPLLGALGVYRCSGVVILIMDPENPLSMPTESKEKLLIEGSYAFQDILHPLCKPLDQKAGWLEYLKYHGFEFAEESDEKGSYIKIKDHQYMISFDGSNVVTKIANKL
ncbi:hypothetical protein ROZALSC1DRAFT_28446 [Rozella allomycis CSF55]|uniref:Uncharacterized protein n=1 Tax=Rozella allomycis (strain CSF55) TaxID=988480 RepID=A0A075AVI2_ROZAC|nr:hypothetical protein O9G_000523 [Rozella allomycis CSF55]RKP20022.1 hypothetical protein ROZALSC1DRAFT_28446 [Rozella allomycis CSF55]|eukprot:EPZ34336.1 hypothetical protein O9G_000523 [Rozella allomycis CSF55]